MAASARLVVASTPTKQQLTDYANALLAVNNYAYAITQTSLPVLNVPPSNYGQFASEFAPAKEHCLNWTQSLLPNMLQVPSTIVNADGLFSFDNTMAGGYLQMLVADPTNQTAKTDLGKALQTMLALVNGQIGVIEGIQTQLTTFGGQLFTDAQALNTIATQALEAAGADQTQITQLNSQIQKLNQDISNLNTWLTISEIGIGVSLFVGLIGVVCCFIPGAQGIGAGLIVLAVAGEAASIAGTVILNKEIAADQAQIGFDQQQIQELNQDIIMLQGVNTQFQALIQANTQAANSLATIKTMWTNLADAIQAVQTDLTSVDTDVTAAQYQQAINDLNAADTAWQDLVAFATALQGVKVQWIDSNGVTHDFSDTSVLVTPGGSQVVTSGSTSSAA